jgi:hypothetical protein
MWEKIKENIAALIAVGVFAWIAGNIQGTSQAALNSRDLTAMKIEIERINVRGEQRRVFMNGASQRLEYLCNKDKDCGQRFDPLTVPE